MKRRLLLAGILLAALGIAGISYVRRDHGPPHYTGFVEGEERVIRSEVSGRVLQVKYAEGDHIPAETVTAVLDDRDIQARIASKEQELAVAAADIRTQAERVDLTESTWKRDLSAREADLQQAQTALDLTERTLQREEKLVKTGASTSQRLDDVRAQRDQARSAFARAREILGRTRAEERTIELARRQLESLKERRQLIQAQLGELRVTHSKYTIVSPQVATVMQTQFIWPGELAQPGTAIVSVLDPMDKYVQIYVPVAGIGQIHLGQHVEIELDSRPGERLRGEVSFIADQANFTPEKIETRSDRMGQVYRVKIRILEQVEQLKPGTEGNVYPVGNGDGRNHRDRDEG